MVYSTEIKNVERKTVTDFKALAYILPGGRNSLVGTATPYRLGGPGGMGGGEIFGPNQPPL